MYEPIREDNIFILFYGGVIAMALMASCYLLFRRANAIAPDIMSPVRLRRWTAAFFMVFVLNHVWFLPTYVLTSSDDAMMFGLVGTLLDCMTFFPLAIIVLLVMLQDRRRPLWPVPVMVAPLVVGMMWSIINRSLTILPMLCVYLLLMSIGLLIYMIRALRQYGSWLRDNYADLEHKEVWRSFMVLAIMLLVFCIYAFSDRGIAFEYVLQVVVVVLICFLLWRVETLGDLSLTVNDAEEETGDTENVKDDDLPLSIRNRSTLVALPAKNIGLLLQKYCIDEQLYLQHELTLLQLAKAIGTNRLYLSQYFSSQDTTYNAYINNLRINHFVSLYQEAVATHRPFTAQQLASESGYRSYSTFRHAFKQHIGQNVREWMSDTDHNCPNQQK
ncbi:MAG: helix-turn-helix domain-containing protein [Bacteroidaceae bacterium]|nr:helix-turn-helix domain-containing protein [Bacteroidaceae bacterium]